MLNIFEINVLKIIFLHKKNIFIEQLTYYVDGVQKT